jgi:hypothetical protein
MAGQYRVGVDGDWWFIDADKARAFVGYVRNRIVAGDTLAELKANIKAKIIEHEPAAAGKGLRWYWETVIAWPTWSSARIRRIRDALEQPE